MSRFLHFSFLFLFFCNSFQSYGCKCKSTELTIVECRKFDAILSCEIVSISPCTDGKSVARAKVLERFKGEAIQEVNLLFDCASSCMMSLSENQIWLVYGRKNSNQQLELNLCDRNRMQFKNAEEDFYQSNTGLSFDEEINYLKKNIGLKIVPTQSNEKAIDITQRQNDETSGTNKILLLCVSLFLFLAMYFAANKLMK